MKYRKLLKTQFNSPKFNIYHSRIKSSNNGNRIKHY
jgi:hypothetical protein